MNNAEVISKQKANIRKSDARHCSVCEQQDPTHYVTVKHGNQTASFAACDDCQKDDKAVINLYFSNYAYSRRVEAGAA